MDINQCGKMDEKKMTVIEIVEAMFKWMNTDQMDK